MAAFSRPAIFMSATLLRMQRDWLARALFAASAAAAAALLLRWRRRRLADPIPPGIFVKTLTEAEAAATEFSHFEVSQETLSSWEGEAVIVWHRGADELYATQEACPHASISLLDFPDTSWPHTRANRDAPYVRLLGCVPADAEADAAELHRPRAR